MDPSTHRHIHSLPNELVLQILEFVMTSNVPLDLNCFMITGQRLQSGKLSERNRRILRSENARGSALEDSLQLPQRIFHSHLDDNHKAHYLDWLVPSTCRRWRSVGQAVFFSSKTVILEPSTLESLLRGKARNISQIDQAIAVDRIRSVIAPLSDDTSYRRILLYSALPRLRVLRLGLHQTMKVARRGNPHIWIDSPADFSLLLRDCGLKTENISIYCYRRIPPWYGRTYEEYLASWIYPHLQYRADQLRRKRLYLDQSGSL